jgi:nitrate reductase assembly molybdenum cofactor insertion protein NarJ
MGPKKKRTRHITGIKRMEKHFLRTTRDVDIVDFDERWWTTFESPQRELLTAPLQR